MNPVGGKLLPDNLTTQANVVRYPLYSRHFTFIVEANQPKAIRDYAVTIAPVEARQPACLAIRENRINPIISSCVAYPFQLQVYWDRLCNITALPDQLESSAVLSPFGLP